MIEKKIDRIAWLVSMAIGVPMITAAYWLGILP